MRIQYIYYYISKIELYHVRFHELGYLGKFWKVFFFKEKYCFYFFTLFYPILIFDQNGKVLLTLDHWNLKLCTFYKQLKNITNEREKILFKNTYVHLIQFMNTIWFLYVQPFMHLLCLVMPHPSSFCWTMEHRLMLWIASNTRRCSEPVRWGTPAWCNHW